MKRWLVGGGIVVSVVVAFAVAVAAGMFLGAGGLAAGGPGAAPEASSAPVVSMSPTPTPAPASSPAKADPTVALFVGDSYTVGQGASSRASRWSTIVAGELGWTERNVADKATGFVRRYPERDLLSYREQLRSAQPEGVDVVVIAGGQNDFAELRDRPEVVFEAVAATYDLAAGRFPDAEIIAVGPSTPWAVRLEVRALDSAVRAAAEKHGATYVSLIDPDVVRDGYVHSDGVHVTDQGYAAIARRVISQIS